MTMSKKLIDIHGVEIKEGDSVIIRNTDNPFKPPMISRDASLMELFHLQRIIYEPTGKPVYSFEKVVCDSNGKPIR